MKIAVITCYLDPDYVRARTLRAGFRANPNNKVIIVKNNRTGLARYPEIVYKLLALRAQKPDIYVLTFRGQEILPFVLLAAGSKPVIFDEFVVPLAYASEEKHKRTFSNTTKHLLARIGNSVYKRELRRCRFVISDTFADASLSAKLSQVNLSRYRVVPVGADDKLFKPLTQAKPNDQTKDFTVFFYGLHKLPHHGLDIILDASLKFTNEPVLFVIVGGGKAARVAVLKASERGARIDYRSWVEFEKLPELIHKADLCLAGPFGGTPQANRVITGKAYQYLACQAPALLGINAATEEFFVNKVNCLLTEQGNADALAAQIKWAYEHPKELLTIAANGRQLYERKFSTSAIARLLNELLVEVG